MTEVEADAAAIDRDAILASDFALCRFMRWSYEDVMRLPVSVYGALATWVGTQAAESPFGEI